LKTYETKTREVTTTYAKEVVCDLCGSVALIPHRPWSENVGHTSEVTISYIEGLADYDGGGNTRTSSVDVCPECFKSRLIPWLESQGAKITTEELDF
jgi:hypothetical protein